MKKEYRSIKAFSANEAELADLPKKFPVRVFQD